MKSEGVVTRFLPRSSEHAKGQQFRRINDPIFGGPRGSRQRYSSSIAAKDVVTKTDRWGA
jgi:hypothetical protein